MATYVAEGRGGRARCGAHRRLSEVLRYGQPIWSLLVSGAQKHYSARLSTVRAEESERASERGVEPCVLSTLVAGPRGKGRRESLPRRGGGSPAESWTTRYFVACADPRGEKEEKLRESKRRE